MHLEAEYLVNVYIKLVFAPCAYLSKNVAERVL